MCGRCDVRSLALLLLLALLAAGVTDVIGVTPSVKPVGTRGVTPGVTPGVTSHVTPRVNTETLAPDADRNSSGITVHRCRSLEMERFTCWWNPKSEDRAGSYALRYVIQNKMSNDTSTYYECPDYTTGGPNSCYFNKTFTLIFTEYCFTVWDKSELFVEKLQPWYCTYVSDITQTTPPRNLTWENVNGHNEVRLRWKPPPEPDLHSGWMSLIYQIRYRNNGSVNWTLREEPLTVTHHGIVRPEPKRPLEVQVRCKPFVSGIWSEWSESLLVVTEGFDLLQVLLVLGVLVSCCLVATLLLLLLLRCHTRLTKWLFPPVPSPRIRGIDSDMLKKGPVEEINRMISSFHGFVSPVVHDDLWLEVTEVTCERDTLLTKVKGSPATPTHARAKRPGDVATAAVAAVAVVPDLLSYLRGDPPPCVPSPENSAKSTLDTNDGDDDGDDVRNKRGGEATRGAAAAAPPPGECYTQVWDVSPDGTVCLASPGACAARRPAMAADPPSSPNLSAAPIGERASSEGSGEPSANGDKAAAPPARPHLMHLNLHVLPLAPSPPPQSRKAEGSGAGGNARTAASRDDNDNDEQVDVASLAPGNPSDATPLRSPDSPPPVPDYTAVHAVDAHQRLFLDARTDVAKGNGGEARKGYLPPEQLHALLLAGSGCTQGYVGEERARFVRS